MNPFKNYRQFQIIKNHVKCRHIIVGDYSYYSGYYEGKPFEDCVMYLDEQDNNDPEVDKLIVGKFCSIATGVKFMMGGNQGHNYRWIASYPLDDFESGLNNFESGPSKSFELKGDTVIGNDVWLGAESMIMPGIHIGDGAVVGARALVTKNIGPYEIWGGNPARLIKKRFSDEDVCKLLQIKWWNWDESTLRKNLSLLQSNDIEALWKWFTNSKKT